MGLCGCLERPLRATCTAVSATLVTHVLCAFGPELDCSIIMQSPLLMIDSLDEYCLPHRTVVLPYPGDSSGSTFKNS